MGDQHADGGRAWPWRPGRAGTSPAATGRRAAGSRLTVLNTAFRALGYIWLGLVAFVIFPPQHAAEAAVQAACYGIVGLSFAALAVLDVRPGTDLHLGTVRIRARWRPVLVGLVAVAAGFASSTGDGGTGLIVFACVATMVAAGDLDVIASIAVSAAAILAIEVGGLATGANIGILLGFPVVALSGLVIGSNRRAYRVQAEQATLLLAQRERIEAEHRRADLLDERARLAREIHDVLAHSLGALGIQIQAARAVLTDQADLARADEILATAQRMAADGLVETRRAVHALRDENRPLAEELAHVCGTHAERFGVETDYGTSGTPRSLPPDATVALLRVAQESLVNAAKHAAGQLISVRLEYDSALVRLTVCNDLAAGPATEGLAEVSTVNGGYGLTGMRERLALLNGTLQAGRRDNQWIVTAELPGSPDLPSSAAQPRSLSEPVTS